MGDLPSPNTRTNLRNILHSELQKRASFDRLSRFSPYPKQLQFMQECRDKRECLLVAGNQVGKTMAAAAYVACAAMGRDQEWQISAINHASGSDRGGVGGVGRGVAEAEGGGTPPYTAAPQDHVDKKEMARMAGFTNSDGVSARDSAIPVDNIGGYDTGGRNNVTMNGVKQGDTSDVQSRRLHSLREGNETPSEHHMREVQENQTEGRYQGSEGGGRSGQGMSGLRGGEGSARTSHSSVLGGQVSGGGHEQHSGAMRGLSQVETPRVPHDEIDDDSDWVMTGRKSVKSQKAPLPSKTASLFRPYLTRPLVIWSSGVTGMGTRDTVQRLLLGRPGQFGTGMIPKEAILDTVSSRGVPDLLDHVKVRHSSGGVSLIYFKSYEMGREKWQGETVDVVWFDEEPPLDIYVEGLTRTNATGGHVFITFTPLQGMSDVVARFLMEPSPDRAVVQMTIDDVAHYTQEEKDRIIAGYPAHEREARAKGVPTMGSGRVFPIEEASITTKAFTIPDHFARVGGMDFGWDHPFAAVELCHDREEDVVYLTRTHRVREQTPVLHCSALRHWGNLTWAWPHDGHSHDKGSGKPLSEQYRTEGLEMYYDHATHPEGGFSLEAGVSKMLTYMQTGRFKVFSHLGEWLEEFRMYHRKDGMIVKERDDLLSATRIAFMMLRIAEPIKEVEVKEKYLMGNLRKKVGSWMSK